MATILRIKRSSAAGKPATLKLGEIAYAYGTTPGSFPQQLFLGVDGVDGNGDAQRISVIGGEYFTALLDHTAGTLTAGSGIIVDSNKAIDSLIIGNSSSLGGELQLKEATNNGANYIGLKAPNNIAVTKTYILPLLDGSSGQYLKTDGNGQLSFGVADEFIIGNNASTGGVLKLNEATANGTNYVGFQAPVTLAGNQIWTLPTVDGANEEYLKTDGSGNLSFGIANNINVGNSSSVTGSVRFRELTTNGTNYVELKAPNALAANRSFTLPSIDGTAGQYLKTDGSGNLAFQTVDTTLEIATDSGSGAFETNQTLTITGGTALDSSFDDSTNTITINVTNSSIGTTQLTDAGVTNAKLQYPSVFIGAQTITLGAVATTDLSGITSLVVDDLTLNGQTISTTASNKDITLTPHGTGTVVVPAGYKDRAGFTDDSLTTKQYVDSVASGLSVKDSVRAASTANLVATYSNGTLGVGATLTSNSNGRIVLDDVLVPLNSRVLIKDQTSQAHNGIYKVTVIGDSSTSWVLTRDVEADTSIELTGGSFVFVEEGTIGADNGYVFTHTGAPTIGSTALPVSQFSGAGQITAGAALSKIGNQLDVNVDNSSIEVNADALRIKALGVTNSMLAGSIANSKLAYPTITISDESSTQGSISLGQNFEILAGEGIDTQINGNILRIIGELASNSNIGVASFHLDNFAVSTGVVTVSTIDGGSY
jgi:hypothetical protein